MEPVEFLYLSAEHVKAAGLLNIDKIMKDIETSLLLLESKETLERQEAFVLRPSQEQPPFEVNMRGGYFGGEVDLCGLKWLSKITRSEAAQSGLPRSIVLIMLTDSRKGIPLAIMDGTLINSVNNGARVGLAAKYLAREDSQVLGIVGSGLMARAHLFALHHVLKKLTEVKIYDLNRKTAKSYLEDMRKYVTTEMRVVDSVKEAIEGSDVIVTATSRPTSEPIVKDSWVKNGSLYVLFGWNEPEADVVLHSNKIVTMNWHFIKNYGRNMLVKMHESGMIKEDDIYAELVEIVTGEKQGRETEEERIFFTSHGTVAADIAIAARIYRTAKEKGIGQISRLWTKRDALIST